MATKGAASGPDSPASSTLRSDFVAGGSPAAAPGPTASALAPGFVAAPVLAVVDQTHDIRSFRLARPEGFDFRAGQHLALALRLNGETVFRCFSIASAPESRGYLEIAVKKQGPASAALCSTVGVGGLLSIRRPGGRFVYPDGDARPLLLVAGGVGCTPLMSMLRHAVAREPARRVTYLLSARTERDVPFRQEVALLRRQHPSLRVGVALTRESRPGFWPGRISGALLQRAVPDPANTLCYLCGPIPMMEELRRLLDGLGVPQAHVRWELFDNAAASAPEAGSATAVTPEPRPARAAQPPPLAMVPRGEPAQAPAAPAVLPFARKDQVKQILRFAKGEMMLHWSIAIPFMLCFLSGITMKILYNLRDPSLFRELLSATHRISGCALAILPALAIARNWRDYKVHIYNIKVGFSWTIDDLKWLFLVGPATVSKRIVLPEQRKFNAGERLNFMMVMVTYPLFLATGFLLWIEGGHHFLPWLVHISLSLTAPILMFGHIYMAVVNPDTRVGLSGMITGRVDREWAKHHYQRWYRENFEADGTPKKK